MSTIKIYTCHHKASAFLSSNLIEPIHVGKALNLNDIGCMGDNTGDNISYKNPFYCELTAHYWVWKNAQPTDFVGFMHYRRHLNFSDNQSMAEDNWGVINAEELDASYENECGLTTEQITATLEDCDLILPKKWSVTQAGNRSNYSHYMRSEYLHIEHYDEALKIIASDYPEYVSAAEKFNAASDGYYTNMFVMRHDLFDRYSKWLFDISQKLESKISFNNFNSQEKRVIGHISERLLNIFILRELEINPDLKIKEVQRTFIKKETFNGKLAPVYPKGSIPVVICFDDNYAISGAALINSLLKNSQDELNYDIIVLENKISTINKSRLFKLVAEKNNFSLRFFDVNTFTELNDVHVRGHFTAATYARLFIPRLLKDYSKVIFIDADTVVEHDIAELYEIELGTNLVAAVRDIVMEGFVKFGAMSTSSFGIMPAKQYLHKVLAMNKPEKYFQAGIIVFNIDQMNKEDTYQQLMAEMKSGQYWFLDQDIMNKVFYDRVHDLPLEWNVYHGNGNTDDFFPNLVFSTYSQFLRARMKPKMIHFAGENKPWNTSRVDFFDNFAKNIADTPWQYQLYQNLAGQTLGSTNAVTSGAPALLLQTRIKRRLMPMVDRFAPTGSPRRNSLIKYYYIVRRKILG
ncbi:DUF4422 domain-containing protein [Rosenbergiella collisarenosi]|uniref:DUF4422 domain-containing protein n=1 Tax=Rosenbergiella collisarenosi TaxID=1544695 RepID=UPI001BDA8A69|nr:DUF4422 domain-containing protein [Rosenbergiella collisarenosi]MBT0719869.1 DUF4422 domain-containing protein [Rosenbergiella collisarenosi]